MHDLVSVGHFQRDRQFANHANDLPDPLRFRCLRKITQRSTFDKGHRDVVLPVDFTDVVDPADVELLEDLIVAGVNKALSEAADLAKGEMTKAAGSMLPPGFDMSKLGL